MALINDCMLQGTTNKEIKRRLLQLLKRRKWNEEDIKIIEIDKKANDNQHV